LKFNHIAIYRGEDMKTIIRALEEEIPKGYWCRANGEWCKYHEIKKPTLDHRGSIQSNYCHLSEEFVLKKMCGINE